MPPDPQRFACRKVPGKSRRQVRDVQDWAGNESPLFELEEACYSGWMASHRSFNSKGTGLVPENGAVVAL